MKYFYMLVSCRLLPDYYILCLQNIAIKSLKYIYNFFFPEPEFFFIFILKNSYLIYTCLTTIVQS